MSKIIVYIKNYLAVTLPAGAVMGFFTSMMDHDKSIKKTVFYTIKGACLYATTPFVAGYLAYDHHKYTKNYK